LAFLGRSGKWEEEKFTAAPSNLEEAKIWFTESFTKIVLKAKDQPELLALYEKAKSEGLEAHIIIARIHNLICLMAIMMVMVQLLQVYLPN
jgi:peptidyl-tRNA hydrolase